MTLRSLLITFLLFDGHMNGNRCDSRKVLGIIDINVHTVWGWERCNIACDADDTVGYTFMGIRLAHVSLVWLTNCWPGRRFFSTNMTCNVNVILNAAPICLVSRSRCLMTDSGWKHPSCPTQSESPSRAAARFDDATCRGKENVQTEIAKSNFFLTITRK